MSLSGPAVVVAVLAAAVLHAGWNAIAKGVSDRLGLFARAGVANLVVAGVALWWVAAPARASWPWLGASVAVHVGYNLALLTAYRVGDFNQTYPLARGLGPLVVAGVAVLVIGEPLPPVPAMGVVLIAGAVAVLGLTPWRRVRAHRPAVIAAVLTGLAIATYTLIDGFGVRRSGTPAGYTLWLVGLQGLVTVAAIAAARRMRRAAQAEPAGDATTARAWSVAAATGLMSMLAYGLVLWAQTHGALAAVAALRESSVVVAAAIGVVLFNEPMGRVRIIASAAVVTGAVLLAVPHS
jgi:drug/metabolite transporter (DMT)-like permease